MGYYTESVWRSTKHIETLENKEDNDDNIVSGLEISQILRDAVT